MLMHPDGCMNIDRHQCNRPALRATLNVWDLNSMDRRPEVEWLPHAAQRPPPSTILRSRWTHQHHPTKGLTS
jgi:hypothetical protein